MYLVLEVFRVNLFALNQSASFNSSVLALLNKRSILLSLICRVVSSAKRMVKKCVAFGKSLMSNRNNIGPRHNLLTIGQVVFEPSIRYSTKSIMGEFIQ